METDLTPISDAAGESSAHTDADGNRAAQEYLFGPFHLIPARRVLLCASIPQHIGGRALDILTMLVEHRNELVSKRALMARVWPQTVVEDCNLKVNISALRRALGAGDGGSHYIATVNGRGYCFVAPVRTRGASAPEPGSLPRAPLETNAVIPDENLTPELANALDERLNDACRELSVMQSLLRELSSRQIDERQRVLHEIVAVALAEHAVAIRRAHVDHDAAQAAITQVGEQISAVQRAVEVLKGERDREIRSQHWHAAMPTPTGLYFGVPGIQPRYHSRTVPL